MILLKRNRLLNWHIRPKSGILDGWCWNKYLVEETDGVVYNWFEYWKKDNDHYEGIECYTHLATEKVSDEEMMELIIEWFEEAPYTE
jgi:hypothetical protein